MITEKDYNKLKKNKNRMMPYVPIGYNIPKSFDDMTEKDHDILLIAIDEIEIK